MERVSTETASPAVPVEAVTAALRADVEWARTRPRPVVWQAASSERVRVMLEAAAPHIAAPRPTAAECDRLYRMLAEFDDAIGAVKRALMMTAALDDADREIVAAGWAALRVLEGAEEDARDG